MKKLFALLIAVGMIGFVACGGGKEKEKEKARLDSLKKDSIANVLADSVKKVKEADSLECAAKCDSMKKDSCDKAKKGCKK